MGGMIDMVGSIEFIVVEAKSSEPASCGIVLLDVVTAGGMASDESWNCSAPTTATGESHGGT
ncbi:hypothetical protein GCM10009104_00580 [Marinobacterium maritimum]|uniref:Uncharacterized protein n=1 Tax=Marinobacterium maritimum TaxID=500162 RepID=A0ABP3TBC9_9GAMM